MGNNRFYLSLSSLLVLWPRRQLPHRGQLGAGVSDQFSARPEPFSRRFFQRDRSHIQPEQCGRMRENLSRQTLRTMHSRAERETPQLRCIQPGLLNTMKIQASCAFRRSPGRRCRNHFSLLDESARAM
ncbi:hypothetical protein EUGRSUZ_L00626 [Eucalyptus grandis]|uniref:Uncharacterized protein n=1 Tax=Eucalyptus grandis TaxID=71139 RepID=A0A058ZX60_EUCGR|nr:hypothetical protein EUGRSUZ_L00626 [Eucalyptus grandis]